MMSPLTNEMLTPLLLWSGWGLSVFTQEAEPETEAVSKQSSRPVVRPEKLSVCGNDELHSASLH